MGGIKADIADYPYQVGLFYRSSYGTWYQTCGGTILSYNTILTASHCTFSKNHRNFAIRAGSSRISYGGQFVSVKTIIEHPYYDDVSLNNDVSIMKLSTYLVFQIGVQPIDLPAMDFEVPDNIKAKISGWGALTVGGPGPEILKAALVPIVSKEKCMQAYPGDVRPDQICAGKTGVVSEVLFLIFIFNLIKIVMSEFALGCLPR